VCVCVCVSVVWVAAQVGKWGFPKHAAACRDILKEGRHGIAHVHMKVAQEVGAKCRHRF